MCQLTYAPDKRIVGFAVSSMRLPRHRLVSIYLPKIRFLQSDGNVHA